MRKETKEERIKRRKEMVDCGDFVELPGGKLKRNRFGSIYEKKFYTEMRARYGGIILRRGCPDFFIKIGDSRPFFVEVKSNSDRLTKYQKTFWAFLKELGIDVFMSREGEITEEIKKHLRNT